ncbi:MAG: hypothetical protein ACUVSQ_10510 [Pseudanabaenaceae cyanobacterium]
MTLERTAVETVSYRLPELRSGVGKESPPLLQLVGDLRSYQTTIQLALATLTERQLTGAYAERHLARIYQAIAESNHILAEIQALVAG